MDPRKERILQAVVSDYTETTVPVGSQALAARYFLELSAATIRNELADLVDDGFLQQPHTSAGRIPTDRGYRYFVDFLLPTEVVEPSVRRTVRQAFQAAPAHAEAILEVAAAVMSRLSANVAVVTGPVSSGSRLKHLDLAALRPGQALLLLVVAGNLIRNHPIPVDRALDQEQLTRIAHHLNRRHVGVTAAELEAATPEPTEPAGTTGVRAQVVVGLRELDDSATIVVHDGMRNLVGQPEFGDPERLQAVLEVLEAQRVMAGLLQQFDQGVGVQAVIGHENAVEQLWGCSFMVTQYRAGSDLRGTIGVVGPTRLRYGRVAARMQLVSQLTGETLQRSLA